MFEEYSKINLKLNEALTKDLPEGEFFGMLFQSRDTSHLIHLATSSHREHVILNEYYDEIIDKIDELIESYQGLYGKVEIIIPPSKNTDTIPYFQSLYNYITENKKLFDNIVIQNLIDEITTLITTTLYKLKELN